MAKRKKGCEETSKRVATLASQMLRDGFTRPGEKRGVAASALTQAANRKKKRRKSRG
jgi:type IV secretory pathway VirD2 relaxase